MKYFSSLRAAGAVVVGDLPATAGNVHQKCVPISRAVAQKDVDRLQLFLSSSKRLLLLTGAGLSTESGIPDYRSVGVGLYARTSRRPVQYQDYIRSAEARQRYWARNFIGWPRFAATQPNAAHHAVSRWEAVGRLDTVVTQNVDQLHQKAGSKRVVELHGSIHRVVCLACDIAMPRWDLQDLFRAANQGWGGVELSGQIAPDGDVLLDDEVVKSFKVPECPKCGGVLKPDVIFFGDNVPLKVVDHIYSLVEQCDSLLIAGSSLHVYSGYRFALKARSLNRKLAIVNIGETRADKIADLKLDARCGDVLPRIKL